MEIVIKKSLFGSIGFRFDMFAWAKLSELSKQSLSKLNKMPNEEIFPTLLKASNISYCKEHNKKPEKNMAKFLKNVKQVEMVSIINCLNKSKIGGETIEDLIYKNAKKKRMKKS